MSVNKEKDLKYIHGFMKISLSSVCKELNIDRDNVKNGRASAKNIELVRQTIQEKLKNLDDER